MASRMGVSLVLPMIILCALSSCCTAQTFQYSRGWVNGKRSGPIASSKLSDRPMITDEIPDVCKQFFLSEILAHSNPLSVHIIAHDYAANSQQAHSPSFYQRPQIKHESELVPSAPYGFVETPLSSNAFDLNDRYKQNTKPTI